MVDPSEIAEHVRARRKALGLTQADLATRAGTSMQTIVRIEHGEALSVAFGTMVRVLDALSFNVFIEQGIPETSGSAQALNPADIEAYLNERFFGG